LKIQEVPRRIMRYRVYTSGIFVLAFVAILLVLLTPAHAQLGASISVLTWHNDAGRTGQNLSETTLLYNNLSASNFGQICSLPLDGQVYAQPLIVTNVTIGTTTYDSVAYVVTQNDTLYAIDADQRDGGSFCTTLNGPIVSGIHQDTSLLNGQYPVDCNYVGGRAASCQNTVGPIFGILGTPVININGSTGTIYLVTETESCPVGCMPPNISWYHHLHAVDIQTFSDTSVLVAPPGSSPAQAVTFSENHIQRPGLLYLTASQTGGTDMVYVAFSMMDGAGSPYPFGAVFGYDPANLGNTPAYFATSQGIRFSDGGGIWMGAAGLAFGRDSGTAPGFIYLTTGNGTYDATTNWGDSFLKLKPDLSAVAASFTPADQTYRGDDQTCRKPVGYDMDFGSGGPMLIPDSEVPNYPYLAVSSEKEGGLWFMDRTTPGGHLTACDGMCTCNTADTNVVSVYWIGGSYNAGPLAHNSPAFWETAATPDNYVYVAPSHLTRQTPVPLTRFRLCNGATQPPPATMVCGTLQSSVVFTYGATPSISASVAETAVDAIVWAISADGPNAQSTTPGVLYALDAMTMQTLYSSSNTTCAKDVINPATKYSLPTIANGYVYMGTESANTSGVTGLGTFYIFGLRTCQQ
jgi:hypothetical protein